MNGGAKAALLITCAALGGCAGGAQQVKIRPIADPAVALMRGGNELAVGRGELALGNVGLALEAFRKAQRNDPSDARPLAGIADCYAAMGRFDLAQSNYEAALALSPHDQTLLLGLARVLDFEGQPERAAATRAEANAAVQATPAVASRQVAEPPVQIPRPVVGSITVALPPARPVGQVQSHAIALATPRFGASAAPPPQETVPLPHAAQPTEASAQRKVDVALAVEQAPTLSVRGDLRVAATPILVPIEAEPAESDIAAVHIEPPVQGPAPVSLAVALPAGQLAGPGISELRSVADRRMPNTDVVTAQRPRRTARLAKVDIAAPPLTKAQTAELNSLAGEVAIEAPPTHRDTPPAKTATVDDALPAQQSGPRLERLSPGEVALVTTAKPLWRAPKSRSDAVDGVRWVALAPSGERPAIQVLNAARSQGLAASARTVLLNRGWRKIGVGDAPAVQRTSMVLYSKKRAALGRRLAAQFGVRSRAVDRDILVLVLGRDAADRIPGQRRS